jgi:diacylglycerol kinase family enzyme
MFVIVANPGSGPQAGQGVREQIEAALGAAAQPWELVEIGTQGVLAACEEAASRAAAAGGVLVAVGGDGTVNAAAQAALRHGCPLGVVARGTFNLFAREHGLPLEPAEGFRALLDAEVKPVQVGLVNQRIFLANAAVGLYPKLLEDREQAKELLGKRRRWIAVLAGLKSLLQWRWPLVFDAELDGQVARLRTPSLFICNNRLQLERLGIDDDVTGQVGHGALAALVAAPLGAWGKFKLLSWAAFGRLGDAHGLVTLPLRSLILSTRSRSTRKLKVSADGEVLWMEPPLRFSVSPQPLQLLTPRVAPGAPA